jgi:hypothetical protein
VLIMLIEQVMTATQNVAIHEIPAAELIDGDLVITGTESGHSCRYVHGPYVRVDGQVDFAVSLDGGVQGYVGRWNLDPNDRVIVIRKTRRVGGPT